MSPTSKEAGTSIRRVRFRRVALRLNTLAALILAVVLVGMLNYLSYRNYRRFDITRTKFFGLSEKTHSLLGSLTNDVQVTVFFSPSHPYYQHVTHLLDEYAYTSDRLQIEKVDPHRHHARTRELATRLGIQQDDVIVFECDGRVDLIEDRDLVKVEYDTISVPLKPSASYFRGELMISSAINSVAQEHRPTVCYLLGHLERDVDSFDEYTGYSDIVQAIRDDNIDLESVVFGERKTVPVDCDALIVAGPAKRISQPERDLIRHYLDRSGRVLFLLDPLRSGGFEPLLADWGVRLRDDIAVDPTTTLTGQEIVISEYGSHPITKSLANVATSFPLSRSVEPIMDVGADTDPADKPKVVVLAATTESGWAETDLEQNPMAFQVGVDRPGPIPVAVAIEKGPVSGVDVQIRPTRLVVIGDSDFVSNGALGGGNKDFFLGALNWLLEREELMAIEAKPFETYRLMVTRDQKRLLFLSIVLGIPGAVGVVGVLVWLRRRA